MALCQSTYEQNLITTHPLLPFFFLLFFSREGHSFAWTTLFLVASGITNQILILGMHVTSCRSSPANLAEGHD